jgi:hypothetical protein
MNEEQLKDVELYMETIGIKGDWSTFSECTSYRIGESDLCIGYDCAVDDKTGKVFNSLFEVIDFYKLPIIPDNVRTPEEFQEFKNAASGVRTFKAKRDFAKVLFKGEEYEATKVEGDHATFVIDGITYGFSISDNFEQEKPVILEPLFVNVHEVLRRTSVDIEEMFESLILRKMSMIDPSITSMDELYKVISEIDVNTSYRVGEFNKTHKNVFFRGEELFTLEIELKYSLDSFKAEIVFNVIEPKQDSSVQENADD